MQDSSLGDTFRQTVFNPAPPQDIKSTPKLLTNSSTRQSSDKLKSGYDSASYLKLLSNLQSDEKNHTMTFDNRHERRLSGSRPVAELPPRTTVTKPQIPKATLNMSRNSSSKKLKASTSSKRYQTSGTSRDARPGNLTSRLQNAERTVLPSQVK